MVVNHVSKSWDDHPNNLQKFPERTPDILTTRQISTNDRTCSWVFTGLISPFVSAKKVLFSWGWSLQVGPSTCLKTLGMILHWWLCALWLQVTMLPPQPTSICVSRSPSDVVPAVRVDTSTSTWRACIGWPTTKLWWKILMIEDLGCCFF